MAVGILQIVVAMFVQVCGFVLMSKSGQLVLDSKIYVWAPLMFFAAGLSTLAAANHSTVRCLNVPAAAAGIAAAAMFITDVSRPRKSWPPHAGNNFPDPSEVVPSGVAGVLCFLEFILCVRVTGCVCCSDTDQPTPTFTNQPHRPDTVNIQAPPTNHVLPTAAAPPMYQTQPTAVYPAPPTVTAPPLHDEKPPDYNSLFGVSPAPN